MKKNIFILLIIIFCNFVVFSYENYCSIDDFKYYEDAKEFFEQNDYGSALKNLNYAKSERVKKIDLEVKTLENAFKTSEVKYAGNFLTDKIKILKEREEFNSVKIIEYYLKIYSIDFFDNSPEKLIDFIKEQKSYPEADYLLGKIYLIEGEYDVAENYFYNAYKFSSVLEIPDEKYEILFSLAELSELKKDFNKMEEYLLLIVSKEPLYRDKNRIDAIQKSISSNKKDCVEKFFKLYRAENYMLVKAFFKLADFYKSQNQNQKALASNALGVVTGFTKVIDIISKRNPIFEYRGLSSFFDEVKSYDDIVEWGIENQFWKGFNDFAENALKNSNVIFSQELYKILACSNPEEYWKEDAQMKLIDFNIN